MKKAIGETLLVFDIVDDKACFRLYKGMKIRMSPLFSYIIGKDITIFNEINAKYPLYITYEKKIDLDRCKPNVLFLQCDFISPTIIGDKYARILKMIPFADGKYECKHLDFLNVAANDLSTVNMILTDESGKQIIFDENNVDDVIISLVFQKRK